MDTRPPCTPSKHEWKHTHTCGRTRTRITQRWRQKCRGVIHVWLAPVCSYYLFGVRVYRFGDTDDNLCVEKIHIGQFSILIIKKKKKINRNEYEKSLRRVVISRGAKQFNVWMDFTSKEGKKKKKKGDRCARTSRSSPFLFHESLRHHRSSSRSTTLSLSISRFASCPSL